MLGATRANATEVTAPSRAAMIRQVESELAHLRQPASQPSLAGATKLPTMSAASHEVDEARLLFYRAQLHTDLDDDTRVAWFDEGRTKAQSVWDREPGNAAAIFWWAANQGGRSRLHKSLASLSAIAHVERVLIELRDAHPEYGYDAADRLLAAIYIAAPAVISVGSYSKAEACLQRALQKFPEFPGNKISWMGFLKAKGREAEAVIAAQALAAPTALQGDYGDFKYDRPGWEEQLAAVLPAPPTTIDKRTGP